MKELAPPNVNLKRLYEKETQCTEPVLIIISPGADPSQELEDLAKQTIGLDKYHQVEIVLTASTKNPQKNKERNKARKANTEAP